MVEVHVQFHKEVLDKVQANRGKQRAAASRGSVPNFAVGEYVLVARVRRSGSTPKLLMAWTGSWRMVVAQPPHVYGVQNIVSGEVSRLPCCSNAFLRRCRSRDHCRAEGFFQHAFTQGEFEMGAIVDTANSENGSGFEVELEWVGFNKEENTREDLAKIWDAASQFVKSELYKLGLKRGVRSQFKQDEFFNAL